MKRQGSTLDDIAQAGMFQGLGSDVLGALAEASERVTLEEDEYLFRQGDLCDAMYIVSSGCLQVFLTREAGTEDVVGEVRSGEAVGEMQILTGGNRTASIRAVRETELVKFPKSSFDPLVDRMEGLIARMNVVIQERLRHNQLVGILPKLFGQLNKEQLALIEEEAEWTWLESGEVLFEQGDAGDSFYVLVNGRLGVAIEDEKGDRRTVDHIKQGGIVGEMALLTDERRSATVFAVRDSELARFSKAEFKSLLSQYPELLMQITQIVVGRLRRILRSAEFASDNTFVAVVPISDGVPLSALASRLTDHLGSFTSALNLNSTSLGTFLGTPGISQLPEDHPNSIRIRAWMASQEDKYRFIICETGGSATNWTKRCLRQADTILLVGNATEKASISEIEERLLQGSDPIARTKPILILIHPNGDSLPSGTHEWLERRNVQMHHHVRWDRDEDLRRVGRFLGESAIGLVLGGGGARGFAHLGVIRAMKEMGTPIDMIGGTSMGALLAAPCAMGWDYDTIVHESVRRIAASFYDFTLPLCSLLAGRKFAGGLKDFFGEIRIEDLWIPYFCVSSNLSRAEIKIHREGPLWIALRASNGAPGIFPPLSVDGDLFVDGGILDNVPADLMKELCRGRVIAVDVCPPVDLSDNPSYGESISGWKILWRKLVPFTNPISVPSLLTTLLRSAELASVASRRSTIQRAASYVVSLPLEEYQLQDYRLANEIIEAGYKHGKAGLAEWKNSSLTGGPENG